MGERLNTMLAVLNGTIGDHLGRTGNALATPMRCVHDGRAISIDRATLLEIHPTPTPRVVLLVHGLMCTETAWRFRDATDREHDRDYGALLAHDLGYTPLYLRYNSGLAIAANGAALADLLAAVVAAYPTTLEELLLIGHSLGGLVIRSACEVARTQQRSWLRLVRRTISIGTPHLGSPFERVGRVAAGLMRAVPDPYARLAADIGDLRSEAIKDLGDADLRQQDRARHHTPLRPRGWHHPVPFPNGIESFAIAGTAASRRPLGTMASEFLVPVASATAAQGGLPPDRIRVLPGVGHLELAHHSDVYAQIRTWCEEPA